MTEPIKEVQAPNLSWWLAGIGLVCGLLLGGFVVHWYYTDNPITVTKTLLQKVPVKVPVPAAPAQEVAKVDKQPVQVRQVIVYKPEAKAKLNLPDEVKDDVREQVISAATVSADERSQTVSTVIDTETGASQTFVMKEPLPLFAKDFSREASVDFLEKVSGPVVRIQARHDIFQVKSVHFHVVAGGEMPVPIFGMAGKPDAYVGFGASMRF